MKRLTALCLSFLLLFSLLCPAASAEGEVSKRSVSIRTAEEFLHFAEQCVTDTYSRDVTFSLSADIDLSGLTFEPVPYFAGTFLGNGHRIRGLSIREDGSRMGLFRQLSPEAAVRGLHVEGSVTPGGTRFHIGGLVGENYGSVEDCSFTGSVSGLENVGGVVGSNAPGGSVTGCSFRGDVTGEHQIGGIAGENQGLLQNCVNEGAVNTVSIIPESEPSFDIASISEDDFLNLSNIGGVAGENRGVVSDCRNEGAVGYKNVGYNVGGLAGKNYGLVRGGENRGSVLGRRDVGGIAGQLIPYTAWDFSDGKLDSLGDAISYLHVLLGNMSQNLDDTTAGLYTQLQNMNAYVLQATQAFNGILQSLGGIEWSVSGQVSYDPETGVIDFPADVSISWADTSSLTEALNNLYLQAGALSGSLGTGVGTAVEDLKDVSNQIGYIFNLLGEAVEDMGQGEIVTTTDLSLTETYEHDEGALDGCVNYGAVQAENNAGGVVGTIGFEVAFDMENRLDASRFLTSNAKEYLFAVARDCSSFGDVTARLDGAGGIAGGMDLGALVNCVGTGAVSSQSGDYVGGIVGKGAGSAVACWARSTLSGGKYVGGIAGLGEQILDCRAWTYVEKAAEYKGAVAGWAEGEVRGNLYVAGKPAGVDNVSLSGQTDPVPEAEMLALEGVPEGFDSLTVRFVANGETVQVQRIPMGGSVTELPEVANDGVRYWRWDDFDRQHIYHSMEVGGSYYAPGTTIASTEEVPLFLVEGLFYEGQQLEAEPYDAHLPGEELLGAYRLTVPGFEGDLTVRMHCTEPARLYLRNEEGVYRVTPYRTDGQYIVFTIPNGGALALTREEQTADSHTRLLIGAAAAAVLLIGVCAIAGSRKKKRARAESREE